MKKIFTTLLFVVGAAWCCYGQDLNLTEINQERLQINKIGMMTLGGWALGNIAVNGFMAGSATGSRKHFHLGNVYWNLVNISLAGFGFYQALAADPTSLSMAESIKGHYGIQKILLFNAGLDIGYIATGLFLKERSKNVSRNNDRLMGYGNALLLQGGFLFAFDLVLFLVHQSQSAWVENITFNSDGLGLVFNF